MFKSLRIRLTALFVVLTIIPLVIMGYLTSSTGVETLQKEAVRLQSQIARQVSIRLGSFFRERQNELLTLTQVAGLGSLSANVQQGTLLSLLSKQPAYYRLILAQADGLETIRLTRGSLVATANLSDRSGDPLFKETISTNLTQYSQIRFDDDARDRLLTMMIPIEDLFTGQVSAVLIADLRFQNVEEEVLRAFNLTDSDEVFILDQENVVTAHRNPSLVINRTVFDLPSVEGRMVGLNGDDLFLATDKIQLGDLTLTVVAGTSYANATAIATNLFQIFGVITLATLAVSSVIVIIAVSGVVNPIVKLSQVAQAIRDGNLNAKAEVSRSDEIGKMAQTFNSMTDQLRQTLTGLQSHVKELEKARVEREKLISDLQAAKRLAEENSRLKSEFLATMSHELRTPLNAIEGFTGIVMNKLGGTDYNNKTGGYLARIRSNSARLLSLINDFLDLSRVEAGRLEFANQPFSPAQMVKRWQEEIGVLAENKGLKFNVNLDPALPEKMRGDEEAISKIALNLLGNAIKFTEAGEINLSLTCVDGTWSISVQDTGIGLPPHAREFIFEEFRQVDQSSRRKYGGTGLGLAIVQKYTRAMGGTVNVKSELGKGSTFTVSLPANRVN